VKWTASLVKAEMPLESDFAFGREKEARRMKKEKGENSLFKLIPPFCMFSVRQQGFAQK
jgi:hypothetical protein